MTRRGPRHPNEAHASPPAGAAERTAPEAETWNPAEIFPTEQSFETAKRALAARLPAMDGYAGRLGESAAVLLEALDALTSLYQAFSKLHAYASMRFDEDTRVAARQGARQEIEILGTEMARHAAYLRPEILALPPGRIGTTR